MTREFVERDGARLQTAVGSYSFPPHLAWAELVFARHRRTGRSEFLAAWFRSAAERGDHALCRTVITACHLLSLAYREPQLALDALREIVALVADAQPNQSVVLQLPPGLTLTQGTAEQKVLPSTEKTKDGRPLPSPVTWRVRPSSEGTFRLDVETRIGGEVVTQQRNIVITRAKAF